MHLPVAASTLALGLMLACLPADAQTSAAASSPVTTRHPVTTATLAGRVLQLGERDGQCVIQRDAERLPLGIPAPCYFSTGRDHAAQVHVFNGTPIVLIQHAKPSTRTDWNVATDGPICDYAAQAVRDVGGKLEPGMAASGSSPRCDPTEGTDQKNLVYGYDTWPNLKPKKPAAGQPAR